MHLNFRLKFSSFAPASEWVSTASRQWTWRDKKVWITVIGIRSATYFPPFSGHCYAHTPFSLSHLLMFIRQRLPPIELFSAIDYHMLIANISLPLCAAVLISTQKNNWESIKSTWELCLCVWWVHVIYVREACPRQHRLFFTSAKRGWEGV